MKKSRRKYRLEISTHLNESLYSLCCINVSYMSNKGKIIDTVDTLTTLKLLTVSISVLLNSSNTISIGTIYYTKSKTDIIDKLYANSNRLKIKDWENSKNICRKRTIWYVSLDEMKKDISTRIGQVKKLNHEPSIINQ